MAWEWYAAQRERQARRPGEILEGITGKAWSGYNAGLDRARQKARDTADEEIRRAMLEIAQSQEKRLGDEASRRREVEERDFALKVMEALAKSGEAPEGAMAEKYPEVARVFTPAAKLRAEDIERGRVLRRREDVSLGGDMPELPPLMPSRGVDMPFGGEIRMPEVADPEAARLLAIKKRAEEDREKARAAKDAALAGELAQTKRDEAAAALDTAQAGRYTPKYAESMENARIAAQLKAARENLAPVEWPGQFTVSGAFGSEPVDMGESIRGPLDPELVKSIVAGRNMRAPGAAAKPIVAPASVREFEFFWEDFKKRNPGATDEQATEYARQMTGRSDAENRLRDALIRSLFGSAMDARMWGVNKDIDPAEVAGVLDSARRGVGGAVAPPPPPPDGPVDMAAIRAKVKAKQPLSPKELSAAFAAAEADDAFNLELEEGGYLK